MPAILSSSTIRTIINYAGRQITLKYAERTDTWRRIYLSSELREGFVKAMEKASIPDRATVAIMVESEHPSQKDNYPHYTVQFEDDAGEQVGEPGHIDPA